MGNYIAEMEETNGGVSVVSLAGLQSSKSSNRLNQIDKVRAMGVGDHIPLPQLIVCGDQSAGKSSILEGITGIPFPRQDGVCTKFATEIILRHSVAPTNKITATIIPHASRTESEKNAFRAYGRNLSDFSELPEVITEVVALMGIRSDTVREGPAFAADVLRIEVIGNTGLHLTVVDLPGLIAVASDEQTDEDIELVSSLVDSYLESSRTIILAVIQASNDIANQGIIRRARKFDATGERTVGIITKPDLINKNTEGRVALLAKNQDTTKLKLGFFLLKNPNPAQLDAGISLSDRKRQELDFFLSSAWRDHGLDMSRVGIDALREYLQALLDQHIERELPKVRSEIKTLLLQTEQGLVLLGDERPTITHMRAYLTRLSMRFHDLVIAALDGNYHNDYTLFSGTNADEASTRLRAKVHRLNGQFASFMRDNGALRKVCESQKEKPSARNKYGQILLSQKELDNWIKSVYIRTRGRELPGNYNHVLLSELFHEQSSRWETIARDHLGDLFESTTDFVSEVLVYVITEDQVRNELQQLATTKLEESLNRAKLELQHLITDEKRQPITYNHYYTDNIQNARQDSMRSAVHKAVKSAIDENWNGKFHISNTAVDSEKLLASLQKRVIVNMDEQACSEAWAGLNAYYKVAMKTFVDNVCRQVIERHILADLSELFSPTIVTAFSDEDLLRIASEPQKHKERRGDLISLIRSLRESLMHLRN